MKISICIPSYGRPEWLWETISSFQDMAEFEDNLEILVGLTTTDPRLKDYEGIEGFYNHGKLWTLPDGDTTAKWNHLAKQATGDLIMLGSDDIIMRTPKWDSSLIPASAKIPRVYNFDDGRSTKGKIGSPHPIINRAWYETLGYLVILNFITGIVIRGSELLQNVRIHSDI